MLPFLHEDPQDSDNFSGQTALKKEAENTIDSSVTGEV